MPRPTTPMMSTRLDISRARNFPNPLAMARPGTARSQKVFKFYPEEVTFRDVVPGELAEAWITVRNDSARRRKIRVAKPNTKNFQIEVFNEDQANALSPGLSLKIKVTYMANTDVSCHDSLLIQGDGEGNRPAKFVVPLHALAFSANIQFNNYVNLDSVVVGSTTVKYVTFTNIGKKEGEYKIKFEDSTLKVTPASAILAPGESKDVRLEFSPSDVGMIQYQGQVTTIGSENEDVPQIIDVKGNVVKQSLELTMPGKVAGPVNDISFGTLYNGQTRVARGCLVNNSPLPCNFIVTLSDGKDENMNEDDDNEQDSETVRPDILVIPSEGKLQPYSQIELEFVFQPLQTDFRDRKSVV